MIKINRVKNEIHATYSNDFGQKENGTHQVCKSVAAATELTAKMRQAVKNGYGFAVVSAIAEGDQNEYPPII